jgi:rod shape determining protein RodA
MLWNRRLFKNLNWYIPLAVMLLMAIGLVAISSALGVNKTNSLGMHYLQTQVIAIILGVISIVMLQFFDYREFEHYSDILYFCTIGLLLLTLIIGQTIAGGKRWLQLGPVNFQPSELAKVVIILVLASIIEKNRDHIKYLNGFLKTLGYVMFPFILIILQNDLGTSLVLLAIYMGMFYVGGGNARLMFIFFGSIFLILVLLIVSHIYLGTEMVFLKEYQLNRILVFITPGIDPFGIGYNLIQSKIALGSGKLTGKGLFNGTQNQLEFLPENHNDFIFSVIGEEFGFLGVLTVIAFYLLLLWQIFNVAARARDNYGRLVATGIGIMFFFHVMENVGMTMGLMPITGLTLPFISYGGSSMVISLIAIGLVININLRRKKINF